MYESRGGRGNPALQTSFLDGIPAVVTQKEKGKEGQDPGKGQKITRLGIEACKQGERKGGGQSEGF